jgi:hypothetical protein
MLAIATYATKSYCYACEAQAPLVVASLRYAGLDPKSVLFVFAGDKSKESKAAFAHYKTRFDRMGVTCEHVTLNVDCNDNGQHQKKSNLVIAQLQAAAFDEARCAGATQLWSLESDVLPQANALRSLLDTLAFDKGYYDVAMATYPNEAFLGGHGSPTNWIAANVAPDEREVPADLQAWLDYRDRRRAAGMQPDPGEKAAWEQLEKDREACPPKGNVWQLNANRWRQRGWLDFAYPGMGIGGIVPVEWVGTGCTLLSERALNLAHFTGYDGGCTQDLWLCWRAWHPAGLHLATITHSICSHVKMRTVKETTTKDGKTVETERKRPFIHHAHHQLGTERHGHLNSDTKPWDGL